MGERMRLLIIRGDLQSHSGYSAAARDYCQVLAGLFDQLIGVDIHFSSDRPFEPFPFPLVSELEAQRMADQADLALVLSFTTPDRYRCYRNAVNVGLTFWETDRTPLACAERPSWSALANRMDALWTPTSHTREMFERAGVDVPVRIIPWPITMPCVGDSTLPEGTVYDLDRSPWFARRLVNLARFREDQFGWAQWLARNVGPLAAKSVLAGLRSPAEAIPRPRDHALLCVAQDVPRKGLPLLLSEWMEFKRQAEAAPWSLILKTSSVDAAIPLFDLVSYFWEHVQGLKRQLHVVHAGVYLWAEDLANADFERLLGNTLGMITGSLGEGFCGPAAHALALRKPLVAPSHTGLADYLVEDYPYTFATRPTNLTFIRDPLKIYHPASTWHISEPYALAGALTRLAIDTPRRRAEACARAYTYLNRFCGPARVRQLLARELQRLDVRRPYSAAA
jgi:glycosyltransferase involved in cell wall biosynthesis